MTEKIRIYEFIKIYLMDFKIYSPQYVILIEPTSMKKLVWNDETGEFTDSSAIVYIATAKVGKNQIIFDQIWIDEELNEVVHTFPAMCRGRK